MAANKGKAGDEWESNPKLLLKRVEQLKEEAKVAQKACKSSESIEVLIAYVKKTPDPMIGTFEGANPWHATPGGSCEVI